MTTDLPRYLTERQVVALTTLSRATIRRLEAAGFPRHRPLSPGRVGWMESEIFAWLASRPVAQASGSGSQAEATAGRPIEMPEAVA